MTHPAFDDLRHLRRHTSGGWLIVHPLLHHAAPKPKPVVLPMPDGYTTARDLAQEFGLGVRHVRALCAGLPVVRVASPLTHQPANAYPADQARAICRQSAAWISAPSEPPTGYATRSDILAILHCSASALCRYCAAGHIRTTPGSARPQRRYFYNLADAHSLRSKLVAKWVLPGV